MGSVQKLLGQANTHSRRLLFLWQMLGHPLCTNFAITLLVVYVMHSFFAYRQFNRNFTCDDPTILLYELFLPHNADTAGIWCTVQDTALRTPLSYCDKFQKHARPLREEIV
ncbi:hypothetical protein AVEN_43093-1 [Araneus ventricosus]|uniref:Uncharacterized protein n=1 Tax=Araneus ventricosus TaxID=182803 RepID=A0A4Y2PI06_ARAVE|nr:hypothetical protein AVEN_43093-1 [Araneus ventricosus]